MMDNDRYSNLYIVSVEVHAKPGSEMWGNAIGGFLYCVVPEEDAEKAIKSTRIALEEDNYEIKQIEEAIKFENMAWESEEVEIDYKKLAFKATRTKDVHYGPFFIYESDDDG